MTTKVEELQQKADDLLKEARSKIDAIEDGMPSEKVQALEKEHDGLMSKYDETRSSIKRYMRLADEERSREADEEARRREVPQNGNPADANSLSKDRRDDKMTEDEKMERLSLMGRYAEGHRLDDEQLILVKRKLPEDRAYSLYLRFGSRRLHEKVRGLLKAPDPMSNEEREQLAAVFPLAGASGGGVVGTDADGGFTAPDQFMAEIVRKMKDYAGLLAAGVCRTLNTGHGRTIEFTTFDDTANEGAAIAEATATDFTKVTWGQKTVGSQKYTTKAFPVSRELLQDSVYDIEQEIRNAAAERFARILEKHFTNGDNSDAIDGLYKKMQGQTTRQITVANAQLVDHRLFDHLLDLQAKIDPSYRSAGQPRFMLHDTILQAARKIKDSDNRYIWQQGTTGVEPDRLVGFPYFTNAHMDNAQNAANKYPYMFGNFMHYLVRYVRDLNIARLDELGALSDQVIFVGFGRFQGILLNEDGFSILKTS